MLLGFTAASWASASQAMSATRWASALTDAVAAACLALAPGGWIIAGAAVGTALAQTLRRSPRRRALDTTFRMIGASGAGSAACVAAAHLGDGPSVAAAVGMAAWWAAGHVFAVITVARVTGRRARDLVTSRAGATLPGALVGSALGATSAWLAVHAPAGLLGLSAPLMLMLTSQSHGARAMAETRILRELLAASSGRSSEGAHLDDAVQLVLSSAARLLGGADVEVVALGVDGVVRFSGHERGEPTRTRVRTGAYDDPWVRRCLQPAPAGSPARARRGREQGRPVLAVRLGPGGTAGAVLVARRPAGAAGFGRQDVVTAEALSARTSTWLLTQAHVSADTDGTASVGSVTLTAVRSSAARLGRLVDPPATDEPDLDAVVEELHELERSVAALLGAPAVAWAAVAEPAEPLPPSDTSVWTTSGTLPAPTP